MRNVAAHINTIINLAGFFILLSQPVIAQQISKDNYTGEWISPASWVPEWPAPATTVSGFDVSINGYITAEGPLSFSGSAAILKVYDTLVVNGDLLMSNNSQLIIENDGLLIVRGNVSMENQGIISANGYLIVTGNFKKTGSLVQGSFLSNDNPVKVFIGGSLDPDELNDNLNYPVLNCASPLTTPYTNTGCSFGNLTDLLADPVYKFYLATCGKATATVSSPLCEGGTIKLLASEDGISYIWSGPNGFYSYVRDPAIYPATIANSGRYTVTVTFSDGCSPAADVDVIVNQVPNLVISNPSPVCTPLTVNLKDASITSGSTPDLTFSYWSNPEATSAYTTPETATGGIYYIKGTAVSGCSIFKPVIVTVTPVPDVSITSSSNAMCLNDKKTLTGYPEGGSFAVISGPGIISGNVLTASGKGDVKISYTYSGVCTGTATQTVHYFDSPVSAPGPDQVLRNIFETQMNARLSAYQLGEWTLVSGPGQISDIHSPIAKITGLEIGESIFRWKVLLGSCESDDEVRITVLELFIPSVITPNGDGKNDLFTVYSLNGHAELIILNRWGMTEYSNYDYHNEWDGRNNKGSDLPDDTYMYILKFESGLVKKGTVLIKR